MLSDKIASAPAHTVPEPPRGEAPRPTARPRSRYIPALDGIRTLAVAAVVLYHLGLGWMQGGLQGVTMFFVLSGYLITHLLIVEYDGTGRIDLKDFWIRRARRLMPAVLIVIVATIILCALFNHVMLTKMRPDIIPSIFFFNNWWQIIRNVSYFDALGDPSPLTHFWSLAIEEQFYLIWPLMLIAAWKLGARSKAVRRCALALAAVSALAMALMYNPGVDPSRVYYGTDTRVFSLLIGAWLACIPPRAMRLERPVRHLRRFLETRTGGHAHAGTPHPTYRSATHTEHARAPRSTARYIDAVGAVAFICLMLIVLFTNGYTAFQYQGGTLLVSLLTAALIAACVQPDSLLARIFSIKPLVWLGKRSYGIYLWHYPLLLLMNPVSDISAKPWWAYVAQVVIVVVAAELSYRFIETPFRHGLVGRALAQIKGGTAPAAYLRAHMAPIAAGAMVLVVALGAVALVPDTSALSAEGAALLEKDPDDAQADGQGSDATAPANDVPVASDSSVSQAAYDIVMIGDSVSVRIVPDFEEKFPHGYIDAAKNRQFSAGIDIYRNLVDQNLAGGILVFALGTNGPMTDGQIDTLMDIAGTDRTVAFITTRSPQPWVGATNDTLRRAADRYDNVRIIDWYGYSEGRNDLFDGDGTHLNGQGAAEYVDLVYAAVEDVLPVHLDDPELQQELQTKMQDVTEAVAASLEESIKSCLSGPFTPDGSAAAAQ